ncbi:MAG: 50S ribosomal protein L17, partial [Patescibacteria group bacterium]|nr:50S ribosomal protein L17 [Patescibacteria group bacterium]
MKKNVFGRRFKRDTNERKALFKSLLSALMINERIETTEEKARSIRGIAEKLITRAKKKNSRDSLFKRYLVQEAIDKLTKKISPLFAKTQGGYTRTIKTGNRLSDNAAMAIIEFTKKTVNS